MMATSSKHRCAMPAGLALLAMALIAGCPSAEPKNAGERPAPLVQITAIQAQDEVIRRSYLVSLEPGEQVTVISRASGYVSAWLVDRGDRVRKGQRLAMVERQELNDQQRQAAAALQSAQVNLDNVKLNAERLERLLKDQLVSQSEVDTARTAVRVAEAQVEAAQATLGLSQTRAGYADILAPFEGWVVKRIVEIGSLVGPGGSPLYTIGSISPIKAVAAVPQPDIPRLAVGTPVTLRIDGLAGIAPLQGAIKRFAPSLDLATRTMEVEMDFDNPKGELRPGMYGRAEVILEVLPKAILVPPLAISRRGKGAVAYVVAEGQARERQLELGRTLADGRVEILSGLGIGDQLVVVGRDLIRDGARVRTVEAATP
jgi:RND family efflux transporter MFP subunit